MGYTNSPLTNLTMLSPNHSGLRTHSIDTITVHCVVGQLTAAGIGGCFTSPSRYASCNYGIGSDGKVVLVVPESNRSWCTSSNSNDQRAITIECASDAYAPYAFTTTVYNKLIELVADICKRNNIKKLVWSTNASDRVNHRNGCNLTVHRDYDNKSCPGDWMYARMGQFASAVNSKLGAGGSATIVTPTTPSAPASNQSNFPAVPFTVEVKVPDLNIRTSASNANNSNLTGKFTGKGTFTITKVSGLWGYLKSNAGWIYLGSSEYVTIGKVVSKSLKAGSKLNLNSVALYTTSATNVKATTKTGTFYAWSAEVVNGKIRITNSTANVGKAGQVTGWITQADANKSLA